MRSSKVLAATVGLVLTSIFVTPESGLGVTAPPLLGDPGPERQHEAGLSFGYFKGFGSGTVSILSSPASWSGSDWLKFSIIMGITAAVVDADEDVQGWVQNHRSASTARVAGLAKPLGNGTYTLPALAALYCYGHFSESTRARRAALLGIKSFVITGIFTETIKHISHKHRPRSGYEDDTIWDGPRFSRANLSFPSGHSASAFTVATVVASEYGSNPVVPPLMYGAATLCALSRVHDNAHWASDVILGSVIGYFTAKAVVGRHNVRGDTHLKIRPVIDGRRASLALSYRF
jgi:membrane-associated phospholipid phosphatase